MIKKKKCTLIFDIIFHKKKKKKQNIQTKLKAAGLVQKLRQYKAVGQKGGE